MTVHKVEGGQTVATATVRVGDLAAAADPAAFLAPRWRPVRVPTPAAPLTREGFSVRV